jgi:hypothetical protein
MLLYLKGIFLRAFGSASSTSSILYGHGRGSDFESPKILAFLSVQTFIFTHCVSFVQTFPFLYLKRIMATLAEYVLLGWVDKSMHFLHPVLILDLFLETPNFCLFFSGPNLCQAASISYLPSLSQS